MGRLDDYLESQERIFQAQDDGVLTAAETNHVLRHLQQRQSHPRVADPAERDLRDLLSLDPEDRLRKVQRAIHRYRSPQLVLRLSSLVIDSIHPEPSESSRLIGLTSAVAVRCPGGEVSRLLPLTRLLASAWQQARCRFDEVDRLYRHRGLVSLDRADPVVAAYMLSLQVSYLRARARFDEARQAQRRARLIFKVFGLDYQVHRCDLLLGKVEYDQGRISESIRWTREAVDHIAAGPLRYVALINLLASLAKGERYAEAAEIAQRRAEELRRSKRWWPAIRPHLAWVLGRISQGTGRDSQAVVLLGQAREGLRAVGRHQDAAVVSLEILKSHVRRADMSSVALESRVLLSADTLKHLRPRSIEALKAVVAQKAELEMGLDLAIDHFETASSDQAPDLASER